MAGGSLIMVVAYLMAWGGPIRPQPEPSILVPGPAFEPGQQVKGSLDKEIIRRIIRRHINDVKWCYEQELAKQPELMGRIMVQFTIAANGDVIASVLQNSTMNNAEVEGCTVAAVRRWQFPRPIGGGIVIVSYPFVLTPGTSVQVLGMPQSPGAVDVSEVNDGGWVHRSIDAKGVPANGLIWKSDRGLLLVDTGWTDVQTEAILAWGERKLGQPWIGAVVTHDHDDRDGGLGAVARRHIPIAALDLTVAKLARRGVRDVDVLFTAKDGSVRDPRGFDAMYPGPGHAPDNIVLHFPGVIFGGCLIKANEATNLGFTGDANLAAWPAAIRRVSAAYGVATIVPGHGAVDDGGLSYQHTIDLVAAAVRAQK